MVQHPVFAGEFYAQALPCSQAVRRNKRHQHEDPQEIKRQCYEGAAEQP